MIQNIISSKNGIQKDLLWENPSPTSSFVAQDLTIDEMGNSQDGDWIAVETYEYGIVLTPWSASVTQWNYSLSQVYYKYNNSWVQGSHRWFHLLGTVITFEDVVTWTSQGYKSNDNATWVPYRIWRIRMPLFA